MPETTDDKIARLDALSREPAREPMGHHAPPPSPQGKRLEDEAEVRRLRSALAEAVAIIHSLRHYDERDEG